MGKTNIVSGCALLLALAASCGDIDESSDQPAASGMTGEESSLPEGELANAQEALSVSGFMLRNNVNARCVEVGTTAGSYAFLTACNPAKITQRWYFDGGLLKNSASAMCLQIQDASLSSGASAQLGSCRGGSNQDFRFYPVRGPAGSTVIDWFLVVRHSGQCVSAEAAIPYDQDVVQSPSCSTLAHLRLLF